jgi:predicted phosphodiesterase
VVGSSGVEGCPMKRVHLAANLHVRVALVGHTHRPGIDWTVVETGRGVPIVDAGSWTYGRAEFAVIAEDGIGLARLA